MRVDLRSGCAALVLVGAVAAQAQGRVEFPSVVDRCIGVRADAGSGHVVALGTGAPGCVEAGDLELFGVAGLRVAGVRASGRAGRVPLGVSAAQLMAPVGSETRVEFELGYAPGARWRASLRAGIELVAIDGAAPERARVVGVLSRADAGPVTALADVDVVARDETRDVEVTIGVIARAGDAASVVGTARFDGVGVAAAGVALVSRLSSALSLAAGYDDGTESVRGAAVVSLSNWRVCTGVFYHAVLGVSHGVTIAWVR